MSTKNYVIFPKYVYVYVYVYIFIGILKTRINKMNKRLIYKINFVSFSFFSFVKISSWFLVITSPRDMILC